MALKPLPPAADIASMQAYEDLDRVAESRRHVRLRLLGLDTVRTPNVVTVGFALFIAAYFVRIAIQDPIGPLRFLGFVAWATLVAAMIALKSGHRLAQLPVLAVALLILAWRADSIVGLSLSLLGAAFVVVHIVVESEVLRRTESLRSLDAWLAAKLRIDRD
jgi:hypothetical protein